MQIGMQRIKYVASIILLLLVGSFLNENVEASAVTYEPSGRLGDHLLTVCRAKWLAYKYNLPFVYEPFHFSDRLMLHVADLGRKDNYKHRVGLSGREVPLDRDASILYVVSYFVELDQWDSWENNGLPQFHDAGYMAEIKQLIKPRFPISEMQIPEGMVSVAVHVRKGSGSDGPLLSETENGTWSRQQFMDCDFPYKFPPDQFYIDQIAYLASLLKDQPLYIHIFTDHVNPKQIVDKYAAALHNPNLTFGYRQAQNAHQTTAIDDMFFMAKFDCLIRPDSSFSKVAQLVGDHKIVLYPKISVWQGNMQVITSVAKKEGEKIVYISN